MKFRRTIHPEVKVIDAKSGVVEYVASDETLDSYREIIRAAGWRFNHFKRNAPFVDSHDYSSIEKLVGKVVDFRVEGKQLIETVQWALGVGSALAEMGWKMTEGGFLKAVSVGFFPRRWITPSDRVAWSEQMQELGLAEQNAPRAIYLEQEQVELSSCILGANPNALAKAYKAGALDDTGLEIISQEQVKRATASEAANPGLAALAQVRAREQFLEQFEQALKA